MWDFADVYKKDQFAFSYMTLHEWMYKRQKGRTVKGFLERCGYRSFALCGFSSLGQLLYDELVREGLAPAYIIDKNPALRGKLDVMVISPEQIETPLLVDVVIVCHVYYYNAIADELARHGVPESRIISLNDIVFSI